MQSTWLKKIGLIALVCWALVIQASHALAVTNSVTAGIGGIDNGTLAGGNGTGSGQIDLNIADLALVLQARDLSGTLLTNGSNVTSGQEIYFLLHVDNNTAAQADNIRIEDVLNEAQFAYVAGSIETTTVATGSSDAVIWAGGWVPLSDLLGGPDDLASWADTDSNGSVDRFTAGAAGGQSNQPLNIPANTIRVFRFRVTVK
jgi:hypothetical protein